MINSITKRLNFKLIFGLHMQEAIFKVNTVKEVAKGYIKTMFNIW